MTSSRARRASSCVGGDDDPIGEEELTGLPTADLDTGTGGGCMEVGDFRSGVLGLRLIVVL